MKIFWGCSEFHQYLNNTLSNISDISPVELADKQLSRYLITEIENSVKEVKRSCVVRDQQQTTFTDLE